MCIDLIEIMVYYGFGGIIVVFDCVIKLGKRFFGFPIERRVV